MKTKHNLLLIGMLLFSLFTVGCSAKNELNEIPIISSPYIGVENIQDAEVSLSKQPSLDEYILYGLKQSSDLKAAYNMFLAAQEKAPQVSALPEPRLSYAYFLNAIETRVGPMQHRVGLSQPIPWFGKLSLKEEIANDEAKAALYSFLVRKNKLVANIVRAYYELAYLKEAKKITDANLELLQRWEQVLSQRYRSKSGVQADLIKVQVELGKLEDKLKELKDLEEPLNAEFNSLLNRPISSVIFVSSDALAKKPSLNLGTSKEELRKVLNQQNPELQFLNALIEAREKGIDLARKDYFPDFSVGADYTFIGDREEAGVGSGDDGLAAVFSVSIPINFSKYGAGLRQAKYEKQASIEAHKSQSFKLEAALSRNLFEISDSKRRIDLFANTLVPKAEEALESIFTAFESGESSFLDLLDTERELLDFQLMLSRAQADLVIKANELKALLGDFSEQESSIKGDRK